MTIFVLKLYNTSVIKKCNLSIGGHDGNYPADSRSSEILGLKPRRSRLALR
ncbi:hypothetical protein H6G48_22670 [Microcystis flos-aquae FACHB-1344]|uniref:Mobile element protein n=1 Tax=Microcystis flos-aquae FACHB-1344 TaxID=2692899 RepID=A0ABR8HXR6_9CHRO|nr:hypothetical protein [Microcystis flos-aquae]MBD2624314.1 hypothetical protein [Microcystis flos-aquae FACHB-1344]